MLDFTGQVVLITGAGSPKGIGRTIAHTFGRQGAQVVICDINQAGLDANVREMEELGYKAHGIAGNLCEKESVDALVSEIMRKFGRIDVLVNNAGVSQKVTVADMTLDEFVESQGISQDDFDEQCQQYAQGKVKQNLIVQGIMDTEGLSLDDKESLKIQNDLVEQMGASDLAELVDTYGQDYVDESVGLLRVEDFIISNANVSEKVALGDAVGEDAEAAANQAAALDQNENSDGEADVTEDSEVTLNDGTETEEAEEVLDESEGSDGSGDGEDADLEEELGAEDGDETVDAGE